MTHPHESVVGAQHCCAPACHVVIVLLSTIFMNGCALRRTSHDYVFSVTGSVTTEDAVPLEDVDVTLSTSGEVYEAIDLVRTRHVSTDNGGGFVFAYISHELGVKYTITAQKSGFEPQTVTGAAPPAGNHVIRLKKLSKEITQFR